LHTAATLVVAKSDLTYSSICSRVEYSNLQAKTFEIVILWRVIRN